MANQDADAVLRAFAQLIAPYVAQVLREDTPDSPRRRDANFDGESAQQFVSGLRQELTEYALVFFEALKESPNRIDSRHLASQLGAASGREVAGLLTTPLKRHRERHGFPADPWDEEQSPGGQRTFVDRNGHAARIYDALLEHREKHHWAPSVEELLASPESRRPVPTSMYVWAPEYANFTASDDGQKGRASCLRTDRPGTRAVIYRAHEEQGIVALFDVGSDPEPDDEWGYVAWGRFRVLSKRITREELLSVPHLARVFEHIQGRRRIPASVQEALKDILITRFPASREAPAELPVFLPLEERPRASRRRS